MGFDMKKLVFTLVAALTLSVFANAYAAVQNESSTQATLSEAESTNLIFMREEEKLVRDTYITLYQTWGARVAPYNCTSTTAAAEPSTMIFLLSTRSQSYPYSLWQRTMSRYVKR